MLEKIVETQEKHSAILEKHSEILEKHDADLKGIRSDVQNLIGKVNVMGNVQSMHSATLGQIEHRLIAVESTLQDFHVRTVKLEQFVYA